MCLCLKLPENPKHNPKPKGSPPQQKSQTQNPCIIQNPKFTHHDQQNNTQTSLKFYHKLKLKRK